MISILSGIFIKDKDNTSDPAVRRAYGMLCGICGIILNIILFGFKFAAGTLCGSIAITADAFNNLSDAGSSLITLFGFKFAGAAPDSEHPFGHGRIEYISGFCVSLLIILMGFELGKSSISKIIHPEPVDTSILAIAVLVCSILVKIYMYFYNSRIGKKISSPAMTATATDSLSDSISTFVVLLATVFMRLTNINIDGWCGTAVAIFILYAGINAAKDTISPLLGQPPAPELVKDIESTVMAHPEIIGVHDLVVHDYGPGRMMISLHGEVPGNGDINILHDAIDLIERELNEKFQCISVIHMDPISYDDEKTVTLRNEVSRMAKSIDERITVHDFRIVDGPTHTNLIFDAVVPQDFHLNDNQVRDEISSLVSERHPTCLCVINIDKSYV
ncbi:MAG: cation diffusion facilitator family transporter [Oscillospiraceae bacterium]